MNQKKKKHCKIDCYFTFALGFFCIYMKQPSNQTAIEIQKRLQFPKLDKSF